MTIYGLAGLARRRQNLDAQAQAIFTAFSGPKMWLDPSRANAAFTDLYGTTPALENQQIALLLDRSYDFAKLAELVPQPLDFTNTTVWPTTTNVSARTAGGFTTSGVGGVAIGGLTVGKVYELRCVANTNGNVLSVSNSNTNNDNELFKTTGDNTARFKAATAYVQLRINSAGTVAITSLTIRELPGCHVWQDYGGSRPTMVYEGTNGARKAFNLDGDDDSFYSVNQFDGTSTSKMTVILGMRKQNDAQAGFIVELTSDAGGNRAFAMWQQDGSPGNMVMVGAGTQYQSVSLPSTAPDLAVFTGTADFTAANSVTIQRNNNAVVAGTGASGNATFAKDTMYIGRRGNSWLAATGQVFGVMVLGGILPAADLQTLKYAMAAECGLTF